MRRIAVVWLACLWVGLTVPPAVADDPSSTQFATYYFPSAELCTVMVDFAPSHAALEALSKESREALLASRVLQEISANITKCGGSKNVRALAVEIPGTDNYGRPNFGSRKNLLMLEGSAAAVVSRGSGAKIANVSELQPVFKITEY